MKKILVKGVNARRRRDDLPALRAIKRGSRREDLRPHEGGWPNCTVRPAVDETLPYAGIPAVRGLVRKLRKEKFDVAFVFRGRPRDAGAVRVEDSRESDCGERGSRS